MTNQENESVFALEFCSCIFESEPRVVSLHKTKRSAFKRMVKVKNERWYEERGIAQRHGKDPKFVAEIGWMEAWSIREIEIEE